jgi:hypothetical protein
MTSFSTFRAGSGRISGIDKIHANASLKALVSEERPQLIERPAAKHSPGSPALPVKSLLNALQVFQAEKLIVGLCRSHYGLTDDVINVPLESPFPATKPFQGSLAALRAFLLQVGSGSSVTLTDAVEFAAREHLACGQCSNAFDSEVYAERGLSAGNRLCNVYTYVCKKLTCALILVYRSRPILPANEEIALICANGKLSANPADYGRDRALFHCLNIAEKMVVYYKTGRPESDPRNVIGHAVANPHNVVSGQAVLFFDVSVIELLEFKGVAAHLLAFHQGSNFIASSGEPNHGFRQSKSLIFGENKLAFDGLNHRTILTEAAQGEGRK